MKYMIFFLDSLPPWDNIQEAFDFCESTVGCKGIFDKNCKGTDLLTCIEITPAKDPNSPENGCTYQKKG